MCFADCPTRCQRTGWEGGNCKIWEGMVNSGREVPREGRVGPVLLCNFGSLSFTNNHISFVLVLGRLTLGTNARENDALGSLDSINSGNSSHLDRRRNRSLFPGSPSTPSESQLGLERLELNGQRASHTRVRASSSSVDFCPLEPLV